VYVPDCIYSNPHSTRNTAVAKQKLARMSITLPESTLQALDQKIVEQQYESRSQAIVDMINRYLIDDLVAHDEVMVGTLTLVYDVSLKPLRSQLVDLQQQYLEQVISSLHIQLDDEKVLQVMLMQGVSSDLKEIGEQFIALKGVLKGHLELMDAVMPPIPQNTNKGVLS
jgi:CopG family nickel-responsive transcriptional regulator